MTTSASPGNVMAGVEEDCRNLIISFVKKSSSDFADFLASWHEMKFLDIFRGRSNVLEMKYFMQEILIIAKKLTLIPVTEFERIGGLYLLFALYFKQPLTTRVHIRIERKEYVDLLSLIESLKDVSPQAVICFIKLSSFNAFHFVYSEKIHSKEDLRRQCSKAVSEQKSTIITHDNKREQFLKCLKVVNFDMESWRANEAKINEKLAIINKVLPGKKFELNPFLTPKPLPSESLVPSVKRTHKPRMDRGKNRPIKHIPRTFDHDAFQDEEEEEESEEDEEKVYFSLPDL